MDRLDEVKRSVENFQNGTTLFDKVVDSDIVGHREELFKVKDEYSYYKLVILNQETNLRLLQHIHDGSTPSLSEAQAALQKARKEKKSLNEKVEELKASLMSYAEELPALRETLSIEIKELQEPLEELDRQSIKFSEKKQEHRRAIEARIQEKEQLVAKLQSRLQDMDVLIKDMQDGVSTSSATYVM